MNRKDQYEVTPTLEYNENECDIQIRMIPMRDGRRLHTTIFLPPELKNPIGTVLFRSPYFRKGGVPLPPGIGVKHGFAAIYQCCRGTASSEGEFFPSRPQIEEHDGEDTLNWIIKQPWSNGRVAFMGSSYSGFTQWTAAYSGSSAITGMTPHVAAVHSCTSMAYPGGGSYHGFMISWGLSMFHRTKFGYENIPDYDLHLSHLPVNELDLHFDYGVVEFFRDFISSTQKPALARKGLAERFSKVTAPALISGGWYDTFKQENIYSFKLMKETAASEKARRFTRMVIGPWVHAGLLNKEEFGEENDLRLLTSLQTRFTVNSLNDPEKDPLPEQPTVQFFMLGTKDWHFSQEWPPPHREKKFFLRENAALSDTPEKTENSSTTYTYDPADPTPSYNGSRNSIGFYDRCQTEERSDVITFTSPVLEKALVIAGNVKLRLYARSSAPDTDFFATLSDLHPDGRSIFLITGVARARFTPSPEHENFLSPGEIRAYEIDLGDIANTFLPGHAVRIALHSANFPADSRNLNTTAPINEGILMNKAFQEIFHSKEYSSCLILPESELSE